MKIQDYKGYIINFSVYTGEFSCDTKDFIITDTKLDGIKDKINSLRCEDALYNTGVNVFEKVKVLMIYDDGNSAYILTPHNEKIFVSIWNLYKVNDNNINIVCNIDKLNKKRNGLIDEINILRNKLKKYSE